MATTERSVFGSRAFAVGIAQSVAGLALTVAALVVVPKFERIFKDFGTKLPEMTIGVLNVARFLGHYWYLVFLPAVLWPLVNWGVVSLLSPCPEVVVPRRLWYFATWFVLLLPLLFSVVALFLPLIQLVSPLSGGK